MPIDPTLETPNFPETNEGVSAQPSDETSVDPNEVPDLILAVKMQHSEITGDGFEHNNFFKSALPAGLIVEDPQAFVMEKMKSFLYLNEDGEVQISQGYDYAVFLVQIDNQVLEFKPGNIVLFYSDNTKALILGNTQVFSDVSGF